VRGATAKRIRHRVYGDYSPRDREYHGETGRDRVADELRTEFQRRKRSRHRRPLDHPCRAPSERRRFYRKRKRAEQQRKGGGPGRL
jgi:hypothetical protein